VRISFVRTAQEREPYRRGAVERHVHNPGEPVDDGGILLAGLWSGRSAKP